MTLCEGGRTNQPVPDVIALLISDVDGTLVTNDKQLTAATVQAVRALSEAGIAFAVTSSRPPIGLRTLIAPLDITTPIGAFNGGLVVSPEKLEPMDGNPLPAGVARRAIAFLARRRIDIWFDTDRDWLVLDRDGPYVDLEIRTIQSAPTLVQTFDHPLTIDRCYKIVGVSRDFDALAQCERDLNGELGPSATVNRSQPYYLDITHPEANKGRMVRTLSRLLSIPSHAIAAIGDGRNDIAMFDASALSIAMGNADEQVKARAQFVTASNEEDGFAAAIQQWVLSRAPPRRRP
jgi:Cof subfamily protein (haloacid dehalogenase superfamily)